MTWAITLRLVVQLLGLPQHLRTRQQDTHELLDRIARWDARLSGVGSSVLLFWLRTPMFHNRGISSCDLMETE